jgi:hypothetical protein
VSFSGIVTLAYAIHSAPALGEWRRPHFPVPKSDSEVDIVDSELRARGLEGQRVVAASVMPTITHGNANPGDDDRREVGGPHPRPGPLPHEHAAEEVGA